MPDQDDALSLAADLGIHLLELQTPFRIGPINTYLLDGERPALIDCGPNSATVLNELEAGLAGFGQQLDDVGTIAITHHHIDHCGLAGSIASRTSAEVVCLDALAPILEEWIDHAIREDDYAVELMFRHGVDPLVAKALRAMADAVRGWGQSAPAAGRLKSGERARLGGTEFEIVHCPGHSTSDTLFFDPERRIAFGGDHLLAGMPSNAIVSLPLGSPLGEGERRRPLVQYRESLLATRALDIEVVLGGHGPPVTDHRELIDERLARHERRAGRFLEILSSEPLTAHEIATAQWGTVAVTQAFATLSEVLGHLDLLLAEDAIVEEVEGPITRFRRN